MTAALKQVRVLVVEDEFLVAMLIKDMLEMAGCIVKGPIPRLAEALDAVSRDSYDVAVLDINLAGDRIDPVARALSSRNIPFVFVTGYGSGVLPREFDERPRIRKPFKMDDLIGTLGWLVKPESRNASPA